MATIYKCDGCDEEFKREELNRVEFGVARTHSGRHISEFEDDTNFAQFDLCKPCTKKTHNDIKARMRIACECGKE